MKLDGLNYPGQIEQTVSIATTLFENQILGIYLYGSAVLGGLRPDSDIDILVLTNSEMTDRIRAELTRQVMDASGAMGNPEKRPIEITVVNQNDILPWRFPPKCEYMYGEWLRDEIEAGLFPQPQQDADLAILLWQARSHSITLKGEPAEMFLPIIPENDIREAVRRSLPGLLDSLKGDERNVLLTLCRMWFTLETGDICPKNTAAEWVLPRLPEEFIPVMKLALNGYLGKCADNWKSIPVEKEASLLADFLNAKLRHILG